jgi:hypothetical protein
MNSLICVIHGREALPVRAIPHVAGTEILPPRELAICFARKQPAPWTYLQNTTAFRVDGKTTVKVLPKEWNEIIVQLEALETRMEREAPSHAEGKAAWMEQATPLLPAAVFVWRDEFEKDFHLDMKTNSPEVRREGDDVLNYSPMLSEALQSIVLEKVPLPEAAHAQVVTEFTTSARPLRIDPALLALDATARVKCADNIGGTCGVNWTTAGDYRSEIEARIKRQAEGFFTLEEAAQVLAESRPGVDVKEMLAQMKRAFDNGQLAIRNYASQLPTLDNEKIRAWQNLVKISDIDAWLDSLGVGYRFPCAPAETEAQGEASAQGNPRTIQNKTTRRSDALTAILAMAKKNAQDPADYQSVWAALVKMAESPQRPPPLMGFSDEEGVKYRRDDGVMFFTKDALRKRMNSSAR